MAALYPLCFRPVLRRYLWGGRRLESLGKTLPPGNDFAESWEVVDRGADQSVVASGPLTGWTLHRLVEQYPRELLGRHAGNERFPLLLKFLDAQRQLSIQVHPDDERAALIDPPDLGKTEAWVVLAAEPGSFLYAGLQPGVDRQALGRAIEENRCEQLLARIEPRVGDCYFLPAGVVHALGPGLLVAEIQQASDTTYRLYDWNRRGPDGQLRPLHVEQALDVIDFRHGPVTAQQPRAADRPCAERLVSCDKFVLDRWTLNHQPVMIGGDDRCHIIAVIEGAVESPAELSGERLARGSVVLLPAELSATCWQPAPSATLLDAYLP